MSPRELARNLRQSFLCACRGISFAVRSQRNLRILLGMAVAVLASAVALKLTRPEMILLVLTVCLVIVMELLNTSIEFVLNLLEARSHPVVRAAKDIAAGGVLVTVIGSVMVGILLFGHRIFPLLTAGRAGP